MAESLTEKRERTRKAVEKPAIQYRKLRKTMKNSYNVKWKNDDAAKRDFFNLYDKEISEFIEAHHDEYGQQQAAYTTKWFDFSEKYEALVKDYLELFRGQKRFGLDESVSEDERKLNVRNDDAKKEAEKVAVVGPNLMKNLKSGNVKVAVPEADEKDEAIGNVSDGAKKGVHEITKWLYRNCSRRGIGLGDDHSKFVRYFVLTQPLRVKLLGFYLIEKKKRKQPDMLDIMASQVGYEPNLEEFKSAMTATKWKFWMRLDGSYIYWDKLSEGMRKARDYQDVLKNYASLGEVDPPSESDQEQSSEDEKNVDSGKSGDQKENFDKLVKAAKSRKMAFDSFIKAAAKHRALLESKDGKNEKSINDSAKNVQLNFAALVQTDEEILRNGGASYKNAIGEKLDIDQSEKLTSDEAVAKMTGEEKYDIAVTGVSASGSGVSGVGSAVSSIGKRGKFIHWNINSISQEKMFTADGALGSIGCLTSLVSGCMALAAITMHASRETTGELVQKCFEITSNMAAIAQSATENAYKIKNAKDLTEVIGTTATTKAIDHASKAVAYAGIVAGAMNVGVGFAQQGKVLRHQAHQIKGTEGLKEHEQNEGNLALSRRISKGITRNQNNEMISGTAKAISGALQLAGGIMDASLIAAPIGTVLNGIGTAISVVTSIALYFKKKSDKKDTIDEYIGMEEPLEGTDMKESLMDMILRLSEEAIAKMEWTDKQKEYQRELIKKNRSKIKKVIRENVIAMLGFASVDGLYKAIMNEYAEFLYAHAFYKDGILDEDKRVLKKDIKDGSCKKEQAYAEMLKSTGVDVKYPEDSSTPPNVTIEFISTKLQG